MLVEVTNAHEIQHAQNVMAANLQNQFPHVKRRVIGWPAGSFSAQVRFADISGEDVYWWHTSMSDDGQVVYNFFGHGNPADSNSLLIDLQFNIPVVAFSRRQGGAFVRDIAHDTILLAHRGIVTRGRARVPRDLLLREADITPVTAISDVSPNAVDVMIVASITDKKLADQIKDFATEVRRAADSVMSEIHSETTSAKKSELDAELNDYYDEFIGRTVARRASQVTMNCRHGAIVKELRNQLESKGKLYKSVAMDLVLVTPTEVFLYEVKTGLDTQSIYTGIVLLLDKKYPEFVGSAR